MKSRNVNILIVAFVVIGMMAVALFVLIEYAHEVFKDNITVSADGETTSILEVRQLALIPAEEKDYSVNLVCEATGDYLVSVDYTEKIDGGMKDFVVVNVYCLGETVYEGRLSELLNSDKTVEFEATLDSDEPTVVTFKYTMPYETGNEAKDTFADFDVKLTIKKI